MKPRKYHWRSACLSPFKFHLSGLPLRCCRSASASFHVTFLSVLCLLTSVLCQSSRASGSWLVDGQAVQTLDLQTSNTDTNALYADGSRSMEAPLVFAPEVSSSDTGLFKATIPWDAEYDLFSFNEDYEAIVLSPTVESLGFQAGNLIMHGYGVITQPSEGTYISFEEHLLGGGWKTTTVSDSGLSVMNRNYTDNRYLRRDSNDTPLVFDASVSSETTGLIKAFVPWGSQYDFFSFNSAEKTVVLCPTTTVGFEAGKLSMDNGRLELPSEGTTIDFEEHRLGGGWWIDSVLDEPDAIIHKAFADARYIKRTEGVTTNHTIQAGDVLQIQNGIITAINP